MKSKGTLVAGGIVVACVGTYAAWRYGQARFAQAWAEGDFVRAAALANRQMLFRKVGQASVVTAVIVLQVLAAAQAEQG